MICHDCRGLFSALVDDALDAAERTALDNHVAGCVECRRELARFRATVALLRVVEPQRAPAGFVDRVLAAARPEPWHRRLLRALFLPWPAKLPLEALAIVLIGVIVVTMFSETPEVQQAARVEPPSRAIEPAPPAEPEELAATLADDAGDATRPRDLENAARESAKPDVADAQLAARAVVPADVSGRLVVKDRDAAARALPEIVVKARGREVARHAVADATVIELAIPRENWTEFARELAQLGTWSPEREPAERPAEIRVGLLITE